MYYSATFKIDIQSCSFVVFPLSSQLPSLYGGGEIMCS